MARTINARRGVSLFAAAASVLALAGGGLSQRSAAVHRRAVSVGDLDTLYRDAGPAYFGNRVVVKRAIFEATATTASWRSSPCMRKD
jgi:hypothetical protein